MCNRATWDEAAQERNDRERGEAPRTVAEAQQALDSARVMLIACRTGGWTGGGPRWDEAAKWWAREVERCERVLAAVNAEAGAAR